MGAGLRGISRIASLPHTGKGLCGNNGTKSAADLILLEQKWPQTVENQGLEGSQSVGKDEVGSSNLPSSSKCLENFDFRGFFVAIFDFSVWVKMWVSWLTHTVTHTGKGLKSAGQEGCASRPASFSALHHLFHKLPIVAAASSCFCRVAWV